MLGLLYKDYCILKKNIWSMAAVMLLLSVVLLLPASVWEKTGLLSETITAQVIAFTIMPVVVYIDMFACIGGLQKNMLEHDECKAWSNYITASPLGYKEQVLSKYYMMLLSSFAVVVWGFLCDMLSSLVVGSVGSASGIYTTFFYIHIILQAIEYPFLIRFGHKYGNTYKVGLLIVAFYGLMVYLLFGKIPESLSEDFFGFVFNLAASENALPTFALGILALLPYVAALLFYLSYKLSCKWYLKGVEAYEA